MATTTSHKAFSVVFDHSFFNNASTRLGEILQMEPTPSCAEVLRGARMVFRKTGVTGMVLYQSNSGNPGSPMVNLTNNTFFNFTFSVKESVEFLNYSNLDDGAIAYKPGKVIYLFCKVGSSSSNLRTFTVSLLDAYARKKFNQQFSGFLPNESCSVLVKDASDTAVAGNFGVVGNGAATILADSNGNLNVPIDLSKLPDGKYKIEITATAPQVFTFWAEDALVSKSPMGIVSIQYEDITKLTPVSSANVVRFDYNFLAKQTIWRYYVLIKKPVPTNFFATPNNHHFEVSTTAPGITFNRENNGLPTPIVEVQFDGIRPVIFTSASAIGMSEDKIGPIVLKQKKIGSLMEKTLFSNLPNPTVLGTTSDRYNALRNQPKANNVSEMFIYIDEVSAFTS
jgi:hypothetical protein